MLPLFVPKGVDKKTLSAHFVLSSATPLVSPPAANPAAALSAPPCVVASSSVHPEDRWYHEDVLPNLQALRGYLSARFPGLADLDDVLQEAIAKALRVHRQGNLKVTRAFLFVTARNAALDRVRHGTALRIYSLEEAGALSVVEERTSIADQLSTADEVRLLDEAIRTLPPKCREIALLRFRHALTYLEISQQLGIAEASVNAQLQIAVKRCRTYLCEHGVERACLALKHHGRDD